MSMLTFNAIDVETANADRASICQIGVVHVREGAIAERWQTLINPEDWFDPWNISIHGIDESNVQDSRQAQPPAVIERGGLGVEGMSISLRLDAETGTPQDELLEFLSKG